MSIDAPPEARSGVAWRVGVVALVAAILAAGHVWYGNRHAFFDLKIYWLAMRWWADGQPLYDYIKPDATQGELGFTYPPLAALVLRPLAAMPFGAVVAVYTGVSAVLFGLAVWWLVRPLADRWRRPRWFVFALAFLLATALEPIRESFTFGQINFIIVALILFDLLVLLPRGSRLTGVGIGVATALKLVPGVFILYLLVGRRWRAAVVATGTAVGVTTLAALLAPTESRIFWTEKVLHAEGVGQLEYTFNQSVMGILARLADPAPPNQLIWIALAVPVVAFGLWRAGHAATAGGEVAGLTLAGLAGSLASPVSWHHHLFWFVPAILILVDAAIRPEDVASGLRRRSLNLGWAVAVYTTVTFSVIALYEFTFDQPGGPIGFLLSNWFALLMLALLPLLPIRRPQHPTPAAPIMTSRS